MLRKLLIGALILGSVFLLAMDFPTRGTDFASYRCVGGLVEKGNSAADVVGMCGEPFRETRFDMSPERVLVYRFDQDRFVYYFAFMNDRLKRIYQVSCQDDDPNCQ